MAQSMAKCQTFWEKSDFPETSDDSDDVSFGNSIFPVDSEDLPNHLNFI